MDLVPILSTIILISTLITLIVAGASYMTFRLKEKRKQAQMAQLSEVFSADLAELQESDPSVGQTFLSVEMNPPAAAPPPPVNTSQGAPPTVIVQPPVVVGVPMMGQAAPPMQQMPRQVAPQMQPQVAQTPQYEAQPTPQGGMPMEDPYGMQYQPRQPPAPPSPQYSGAQAAFMKGFDGQQQTPSGASGSETQPTPQPGSEYGPPVAMRRFTPPEAKPRPEAPQNYGNDSPAWK